MTITDGDTLLAEIELDGGRGSYATSSLSVGTHSITASFSGTATTAPSSSTILQQIGGPIGTASELPATH